MPPREDGEVTDAIGDDLGGATGWDLEPLPGGFSGETFLGHGPEGDVVVRTYVRDPDRAAIDAALMRLMRGLLPVPEVLDVRLPVAGRPGLLVTERVDGEPLDRLVDERAEVDWGAIGRGLARALATLGGVPALRPGRFTGPDLTVVPHTEDGGSTVTSDLRAWAEHQRDAGRISTWSESDWRGLLDLIDAAEELMAGDARVERAVLVHSDFNLKNLLADPVTWELTAVLDWEFAHAGSPFADVGNLTRFEREPDLLAALDAGLAHWSAVPDPDWFVKGRAADLWALIELAGRPLSNTVTAMAETLLLAQARELDLAAWPWPGPRRSVHAARIGSERGKPVS